jgi:photosystem II stability/assembly factor-like uncharacterized protein
MPRRVIKKVRRRRYDPDLPEVHPYQPRVGRRRLKGMTFPVFVGVIVGAVCFAPTGAPVAPVSHQPAAPSSSAHCRTPVTEEPEGVFNRDLAAVQFVSPATGWAVGGDRILHTTDGGTHWDVVDRPSGSSLSAVDAVDAQHVWVLGRHAVLASDDGGASWHRVTDPCPRIAQLHFYSDTNGYAVAGGALLRTTDGGRSWHIVGAPKHVASECFTSADDGWLGAGGRVFRTLDGGRRWRLHFRGVHGGHPIDRGYAGGQLPLQCAGRDAVWGELIGGAGMSQQAHVGFQINDGNGFGEAVYPEFAEGMFPHPGIARLPESPSDYFGSLSAISPTSAAFVDNCVACGWGSAFLAEVVDTKDLVRVNQAVGGITYASGISFINDDDGWIVGSDRNKHGESERILHTTDGGHSWTVQYATTRRR